MKLKLNHYTTVILIVGIVILVLVVTIYVSNTKSEIEELKAATNDRRSLFDGKSSELSISLRAEFEALSQQYESVDLDISKDMKCAQDYIELNKFHSASILLATSIENRLKKILNKPDFTFFRLIQCAEEKGIFDRSTKLVADKIRQNRNLVHENNYEGKLNHNEKMLNLHSSIKLLRELPVS